jgi:hypothetical protein
MSRFAYLPLALWVGAMICAAGSAGRVFGMLDDNRLAGDVMAGIFKVVDYAGIVAAGVAAMVSFASKPRFVLAVLLVAGACVSVFVLHPKIVAREDLETWHKASEVLWMGLIVGGGILAALGPPRAESRGR